MRSVWLMYHDVYAGEEPDPAIPLTASLYHVSRDSFRRHLEAIRSTGLPVCTVGEHLEGRDAALGDHVVITFDDGWAGSLTVGLECLAEVGVPATFFVTRDYVGRPRFATSSLLREARAAGMEIGTHGCSHRMLARCAEAEIHAELSESKAFLEDLLGEPVTTASVPGGDWSPRVARVARACGYTALCTSLPGLNRADTDPFRLRRMAVRRRTGAETIARYCGFSVTSAVLRYRILEVPRRVLGAERYADLRRHVLVGGRAASP